jgi:cytochrome c oxidase accessory protein FixG
VTPARSNPASAKGRAAPAPSDPKDASILSTLHDDGSRRWLRPRPSPGRFHRARARVAFGLIALFTVLPHIRINHHPAVLLDLTTRRFHILGATFLPTDTVLLALMAVTTFVTIFLITAIFGRVWCGWACPQTVYLEFVYRPIERFFVGLPGKPAKNWFQRSGAGVFFQYTTYVLISMFLAHTFLAYFVGADKLRVWMTQSPLRHPEPFLVMAGVTALMLFDFAFFREQTCIVACPYGRMQSVLLDRGSLIVGYDRARGEPRGRNAPRVAQAQPQPPETNGTHTPISLPVIAPGARTGDCVDCRLCVTTCPTGIDIRNGLQMECIHCAQCIDACDAVMDKLSRPRGLIRYSTPGALEGERRKFLRPRMAIYPLVLAIAISLLVIFFLRRGDAAITVVRGSGAPFYTLPSGEVANPLTIKIVNRLDHDATFEVRSADPGARIICEQSPITVASQQLVTLPATIIAPSGSFTRGQHMASVEVSSSNGTHKAIPYRMMGPARHAREQQNQTEKPKEPT